MAAAMAEGEIMTPNSGGEGTTPEHEPTVAAAQSRSNAGEVSKMQRQIAELEAQLAEKESKATDDLKCGFSYFIFQKSDISCCDGVTGYWSCYAEQQKAQ